MFLLCSANSICPSPAKPLNRLASLSSERCTRGRRLQIGAAMKQINKKLGRPPTHGESRAFSKNRPTREFQAWASMQIRCLNKNCRDYKNYGGRGIKICKRWKKFENFIKDMGRRPSPVHTLGRIKNDGNYEPNNCEWQTIKEQANNRRTNVFKTYNGRTQTIQQWADEYKIDKNRLIQRMKTGWSLEKSLLTPIQKYTKTK
jgi:hypothetical protein